LNHAQGQKLRILVVDDDARIRQMLMRYFEGEGFDVSAVADGRGLRAEFERCPPDLVLLDLVLPGEDGLALAQQVRSRSEIPIIMLTGRNDVVDRVVGLEIGADDYIAKPFHLREVLARVRTVLRRKTPQDQPSAGDGSKLLRFEGWGLDLDRRQLLAADGSEVPLTTAEFDMLVVLVKRPGHVLTRDALMDLTRGRSFAPLDRTIDTQIARLRKKIEPDAKHPTLIKSVRGVGYVFTGKAG
jgi:two-component system, OmpR family, response regulator